MGPPKGMSLRGPIQSAIYSSHNGQSSVFFAGKVDSTMKPAQSIVKRKSGKGANLKENAVEISELERQP